MSTPAVRVPQQKKDGDEMIWDDGSGRREEGNEDRFPLAARLPKSLYDYVKGRAGKGHGELTRVLEDTIRFHKKFFERLGADRVRIQQFALDERLEWPGHGIEVFARLIRKGLDEHERRRK